MTLSQDYRRKQIVELVEKKGKLSSTEIRKKMKVSEKTIRDDLSLLVKERRLMRGYVTKDWDVDSLEKVYYFTANPGIEMGEFEGLPVFAA